MAITGYRQIMEVDVASTLPTNAIPGDVAYAWDTDRHYKWTGTVWKQIATSDEILGMTGKIQTATGGVEYGAWAYPFTATTNASGVATIYLTSDGTSTGTVAAPNKVFNISVNPIGVGAANYNVTNVTVSGDRKTLTVTLNQIKSVLGLLSYNATADAGVAVQGTVWIR